MTSSTSEILHEKISIEIPPQQYMHCNWNVDKKSTVNIVTDANKNLYISLFDRTQYQSFTNGDCYWDTATKDWASGGSGAPGACASSYGGIAKTEPTKITVTWLDITKTPLDSIIYNPGPTSVTLTYIQYSDNSTSPWPHILIGVSCVFVFVGFSFYLYSQNEKSKAAAILAASNSAGANNGLSPKESVRV